MNRAITVGLAAALLAGCATEFQFPATGRIGTEVAFGYATARVSGDSTFTADTTSGLRCVGIYDAYDSSRIITAKVECNDGRKGELEIVRDPSMVTGTAVGTLSDGSRAQFVFGKDVRYEDRFPEGMPVPPPGPRTPR